MSVKQNGTGFLDLSTETAQNTTENGTTALARVWQNGTVPCRLCRVPSCAVCADSLQSALTTDGATAWEKAFLSGCIDRLSEGAELSDRQHAVAVRVVAQVAQRAKMNADPRFAGWAARAQA